MNAFDQMDQAVREAEVVLSAGDKMADKIARFLIGRLRRVTSGYVLRHLKTELRDYNMHTGEWK